MFQRTVLPYLTTSHGCEYTSIAVGVFCWFNTFSPTKGATWRFFRAVTGWKITKREWYQEIAQRILHIQRATLLLGGPDLKWIPLTNDDTPQVLRITPFRAKIRREDYGNPAEGDERRIF